MKRQLTAIIEQEGDGFVALCPEFDIASQGGTIEEARDNFQEALELFFEAASRRKLNIVSVPRERIAENVELEIKIKRYLWNCRLI